MEMGLKCKYCRHQIYFVVEIYIFQKCSNGRGCKDNDIALLILSELFWCKDYEDNRCKDYLVCLDSFRIF